MSGGGGERAIPAAPQRQVGTCADAGLGSAGEHGRGSRVCRGRRGPGLAVPSSLRRALHGSGGPWESWSCAGRPAAVTGGREACVVGLLGKKECLKH